MRQFVKRVARNTKGRDFIIGDIHGCFTKMAAALRAIGFDPEAGDRLFPVGDLVDRGPESIDVMNFLACDFIESIAGNHDYMATMWPEGDMDEGQYRANGGAWMIALDREAQLAVAATLRELPIAIELETELGLVGIVHAECPFNDWQHFVDQLEQPDLEMRTREQLIDVAQWSRNRISMMDDSIVEGVRAVVVGHTPMPDMIKLGNTIFIDTMGWKPQGQFTILDAATLQPAKRKST